MDRTGGALLDMTSTLGNTAGANPWTLPLTLILSLLPALFGRRGQKDMSSLINYLKPSQPLYMSPNLPAVDEAALNAVINQMSRTQDWGWPGGR